MPSAFSPPATGGSGRHASHDVDDGGLLAALRRVWQMPRPDIERRKVSGTAAGIAREIGIDPIYVRVAFVVLTVAGGWGVVLYLAAWFAMGRHPRLGGYEPVAKGVSPAVRLIAFAMVATGLVLLASLLSVTFLGALVWPSALVGAALAISLDRGHIDRSKPLGDFGSQQLVGRLVLGLGCLFAGAAAAFSFSLSFWQALGAILVAGLVLAGAGLVFAPTISGLASDLLAERRRRIRSEERADMAAHLHDSVLQTLALIQKRSGDPGVVSIARRQERELRSWLFDDQASHPSLGFRAGLEAQMASVEGLYEVPIELVIVGDCPPTPGVQAMLLAAREAATNASAHSGAPRVDVFAEVSPDVIEIFVRDQGVGFRLDGIDADRAGVRDSIVGRMERHGGSAVVHSVVDEGTEVELRLPRDATGGAGTGEAATEPQHLTQEHETMNAAMNATASGEGAR